MKIVVSKAEDRDTMVVILARNGYTVRQVKEKRAGDKTYTLLCGGSRAWREK